MFLTLMFKQKMKSPKKLLIAIVIIQMVIIQWLVILSYLTE